MVRDPVELTVSRHARLLRNGKENLRDLRVPWRHRSSAGGDAPSHPAATNGFGCSLGISSPTKRAPAFSFGCSCADGFSSRTWTICPGAPGETLERLGDFLEIKDLADRTPTRGNVGGLPGSSALEAAFDVMLHASNLLRRASGLPGSGPGSRLQRWNTTRRRPLDEIAEGTQHRLAETLAEERRMVDAPRVPRPAPARPGPVPRNHRPSSPPAPQRNASGPVTPGLDARARIRLQSVCGFGADGDGEGRLHPQAPLSLR